MCIFKPHGRTRAFLRNLLELFHATPACRQIETEPYGREVSFCPFKTNGLFELSNFCACAQSDATPLLETVMVVVVSPNPLRVPLT